MEIRKICNWTTKQKIISISICDINKYFTVFLTDSLIITNFIKESWRRVLQIVTCFGWNSKKKVLRKERSILKGSNLSLKIDIWTFRVIPNSKEGKTFKSLLNSYVALLNNSGYPMTNFQIRLRIFEKNEVDMGSFVNAALTVFIKPVL